MSSTRYHQFTLTVEGRKYYQADVSSMRHWMNFKTSLRRCTQSMRLFRRLRFAVDPPVRIVLKVPTVSLRPIMYLTKVAATMMILLKQLEMLIPILHQDLSVNQ